MAKLAYDLEGCDGCVGCDSFNNCFMGLRQSIGDIGKTLKYIFTNLIELDDTICDLITALEKKKIKLPNKKKEVNYYS